MPYRASDSERRNKVQLGVGWSLWGSTPPPPIPERILDGIPGFLVWFTFLFSIASAVAFPYTLLKIAALLGAYTSIRFAVSAMFSYRGLRQIARWEKTDWHQHYEEQKNAHSLAWDEVLHLAIIPNYKEPMSVLRRTLDNLKAQYEADKRLIIVMAMEAGEEQSVSKAQELQAEYSAVFKGFYFTVHPRGLPGEMQCKSANEAWAARWAKRKLVDELGYNLDHICLTTMDADTRWHPQHFFAQTALFALDEHRHERFWQAPIRYHGNVWEINPLLRIVYAYMTAIELSYLASPWWIAMPMSSYALSLRLLHTSGYWDGDVIADEWHMFIKAYFASGGKIKVERIMLPFMADATIGEGLIGELYERYVVSIRHSWGSKEVGYMVAKMIDHPEVEIIPSIRLLFRISHDILMAGAGWMIITVGSQLPVLLHPEIAPFDIQLILKNPSEGLPLAWAGLLHEPAWLVLGTASALVVVLAFVFLLLDIMVRPPRTRPQTLQERFWTVMSLPMMPILTVVVLAIPTILAQTRLLLGIPLQFRVSKKV